MATPGMSMNPQQATMFGWPSGTNPSNVPSSTPAGGSPTNYFSPYSGSGNMFGMPSNYQPIQNSPGGGMKSQITNSAYLNNILGQQRSNIGNSMANTMFGYAAPAGGYYQNLMNLGSPYYNQQQRASFENAAQNYGNTMAQARQQAQAAGLGYGPSGANVGMMGNQATNFSQNLTQNYLQNLFQNEMLQLQGAQGLGGLAGQFNPAGILSSSLPIGQNSATQAPSYMSGSGGLLGGIAKLFGL